MKAYLRLLVILLAVAVSPGAHAQGNFPKCLAKIQARLDALGDVGKQEFNIVILRQDIKDYDIGKLSDVVRDANKTKAFKLIYESLSEFTDLAGSNLSAKGMRGYSRYAPCIIKADGTDTVAHLKQAFTRSGAFKGNDFDLVMKQLADDARFTLDAPNRTFTSNASGLKFGPETYAQGGEKHSVNHVFRGHLANEFTDAATNPKSIFPKADEVFDLIDQAWQSTNKTPYPNSSTGWIVDLAPKIVGFDQTGQATTKLAIFVNSGSVFRTAFPY